jgi:hypothetical protein
LRGKPEQLAPGVDQDAPDVGPCCRHEAGSFVFGRGEHFGAQPRELERLVAPRILLLAIVIDHVGNARRWSKTLRGWVLHGWIDTRL